MELQQLINNIDNGDITLSFSALKAFSSSPKDFIAYKLRDKEQTDAMILGDVLHTIVFQPEKFDTKFFLLDDNNVCAQIGGAKPRATKAYKEWKEEQLSENEGKIIVDTDTYKQAFSMRNALMDNAVSSRHLNRCSVKEMEVNWNYMDKKFKGFVDGGHIVQEGAMILDLKKVVSAHPKKVERLVFDELYYMQLAMYRMALMQSHNIDMELTKCYIVAVDANCHVSVNKVHLDLLKFGEEKLTHLIAKFNECTFKNKWHEDYEFWSEYGGIFLIDRPAHSYK